MLARFEAMRQDAMERCIKISRDQIAILVLADVIEDQGIELSKILENLETTLS